MRILNLIVAILLVAAAAWVYKIKFEATVEAEKVGKLRAEIVREHDASAALRAEAAKLENPARIQALARRHLQLQLLDPAQIEAPESLPMRPAEPAEPDVGDPIAAMIDGASTGSLGVASSVPSPSAAPASARPGRKP